MLINIQFFFYSSFLIQDKDQSNEKVEENECGGLADHPDNKSEEMVDNEKKQQINLPDITHVSS